jgi:hypothetical protein
MEAESIARREREKLRRVKQIYSDYDGYIRAMEFQRQYADYQRLVEYEQFVKRTREELEMAFPFITTPNFLHWAESRRFTNSLLRELGQEWPLGDMPGYVYQDKAWIGLYRTTQGRLLYFMDVPPSIHITEDQTEAEAWVWEHFSKFQTLNDKFEQGLRT